MKDSTMTKVRVVYDASCTTSNGKSLNVILCIGPPLQNDLGGVIRKWRLHRYVFSAVIQRLYRCIDMHQVDAQFQRILWRNDPNEYAEYSPITANFGTASATYTVIRVLRQFAQDEKQERISKFVDSLATSAVKPGLHQLHVWLSPDWLREDENLWLKNTYSHSMKRIKNKEDNRPNHMFAQLTMY